MNNVSKRWRENLIAYAYLAPFLTVFLVFLGYPVLYSFWLSFRQATIYSDWYNIFGDMRFVGLENYRLLLADKEFWWSLCLTLIYGLLTVPTGIALALLLALLLKGQLKGSSLYRSAYFLPNVLDMLVIGIIWTLIMSPKYGLLDVMLQKIGITYFSTHGLLSEPLTCLPAIALAMVLKGAGFGMILFLTAIQNIPSSIYEAADIDGAGWWHKLRYITLPLVKPIILFMVITGTIAALTAFTEIYAMTTNTGGPTVQVWGTTMRAAKLSGYFLYRNFADGFYGKAAAVSFVLLFIGLSISLINMRMLRSRD